jgi:hypothetical protein
MIFSEDENIQDEKHKGNPSAESLLTYFVMNPMSTSKWFQSTWVYFITTKLKGKTNQMVWDSQAGNFPTPKMFCSPKPNN